MNYKSTKRVQKVQDKRGEKDENFGSDKMKRGGKRLGEQIMSNRTERTFCCH